MTEPVVLADNLGGDQESEGEPAIPDEPEEERDVSHLLKVPSFGNRDERRTESPAATTMAGASDSDMYPAQLMVSLRRGWALPNSMTDAQRRLSVDVVFEVAETLQVVSVRLRATSGNVDFDQSVMAHVEQLQTSGWEIPAPPPSVRARYIGVPFAVRFHGRNAR